jgi:3'-5' exoribonuclease
MSALVKETANKLGYDNERVMLLQHMILSHHGKQEFGSPVLPLTLEAEILSFIDNLDSRINMITKALNDVNEGEFTNHQYGLEGRCIYKPHKD